LTAKRERHFRQGDLAEGLGRELLRGLAAVAPVPREEDVGFDLVATLLRREADLLFAESSFLVQVKSKSASKLSYNPEQFRWFTKLSLPLFIGKVDLGTARIDLFSTYDALRVNAVEETLYEEVVFYLSKGAWDKRFATRRSRKTAPPVKTSDSPDKEILRIDSSKPILSWTMKDLMDEAFCVQAYRVLSEWVHLWNLNRGLAPIHMARSIDWQTNQVPRFGGTFTYDSPNLWDEMFQAMSPMLHRLGSHLQSQHHRMKAGTPEEQYFEKLHESVTNLFDYLKQMGVDPDPNRHQARGIATSKRQKSGDDPESK